MKRKTKERGITLVSLAVTIIVILILAAVTVRLALGDGGVLDEAQLAANEWDKAVLGEQSDLAKLANEMRKARNGIIINGGNTGGGSSESGNETGGSNTNETGGNTGDDNPSGGVKPGQVYGEETKITVDGKPVTVPGGATISGVEGETSIDNGLVIYIIPEGETVDWSNEAEVEYAQKTYSQFVWVPVDNPVLDLSNRASSLASDETVKAAVELEISRGKYPMSIKNADGNYFGVLYQFKYDGEKDEVIPEPYTNWTPLGNTKEPSVRIGGESGLGYINGILNTKLSTNNDFATFLQEKYNEMVNNVIANNGFWIGRYETSAMNGSTTTEYVKSNEVQVSSVKDATTGIDRVNWYQVYGQLAIYSNKANITGKSSMIWGSQWDQVMVYLKNVKNTTKGEYIYYVINSENMGSWSKTSTGKSATYAAKNIYDLYGNVQEYTLEASTTVLGNGTTTGIRILRGGTPGTSGTLYAAYRSSTYQVTTNISGHGSRMVLY